MLNSMRRHASGGSKKETSANFRSRSPKNSEVRLQDCGTSYFKKATAMRAKFALTIDDLSTFLETHGTKAVDLRRNGTFFDLNTTLQQIGAGVRHRKIQNWRG